MSLKTKIMYYQLADFYKRDTSFIFNEDINEIDYFDLMKGERLDCDCLIKYEVDRIDPYINDYDVLPSLGAPLVSKKFKDIFIHLEDKEIDFFEVLIVDNKGRTNNDFFCINVLNSISCMDLDKSIVDKTKYGTMRIKKLFLSTHALENYSTIILFI